MSLGQGAPLPKGLLGALPPAESILGLLRALSYQAYLQVHHGVFTGPDGLCGLRAHSYFQLGLAGRRANAHLSNPDRAE